MKATLFTNNKTIALAYLSRNQRKKCMLSNAMRLSLGQMVIMGLNAKGLGCFL